MCISYDNTAVKLASKFLVIMEIMTKHGDPLYIQLFTALKLTLLIQCRQNVSECCLVTCYMLLLLMSVEAEALIAPSAAFVINAVLVIGTADQPADHE